MIAGDDQRPLGAAIARWPCRCRRAVPRPGTSSGTTRKPRDVHAASSRPTTNISSRDFAQRLRAAGR